MTTVEEWREFLQRWSDEWLSTSQDFPVAVRNSGWLGFKPATEKQIVSLEKRLGYALPPSYRAFLLTTNGWRRTSAFIEQIRPIAKVQWLEVDDPQILDAWETGDPGDGPLDGLSAKEYFSYKPSLAFDKSHFRQSLKIAESFPGDSQICVLNPKVVAEDGEWEAWRHAHWIPGAERFPSFALLMQSEYRSFLQTELNQTTAKSILGPFKGPYAPSRQRHEATRIGAGKAKPRRLTVPELIDQLEDADKKKRLAAANTLFREFAPHDPSKEKPALVPQLVRILKSKLERDVCCAAACMLGTHGDDGAIKPLVDALADADVAPSAVGALHYLSIHKQDPLIADGFAKFLDEPRDPSSTSTALHVLEDLGYPKLRDIALRLLDREPSEQMKCQAAFALAGTGKSATNELIDRLSSENADIRTAAAAALRQTKDRAAVKPLYAAMKDRDPNARMQAAMSLRFFDEPVTVSPTDTEAARQQTLKKMMEQAAKMGFAPPPGLLGEEAD